MNKLPIKELIRKFCIFLTGLFLGYCVYYTLTVAPNGLNATFQHNATWLAGAVVISIGGFAALIAFIMFLIGEI